MLKSNLRDGCKWFFEELHKHEVPVLVFSAGVGDIILETITQQATFYDDNMKIVSNMLKFDETVSSHINHSEIFFLGIT